MLSDLYGVDVALELGKTREYRYFLMPMRNGEIWDGPAPMDNDDMDLNPDWVGPKADEEYRKIHRPDTPWDNLLPSWYFFLGPAEQEYEEGYEEGDEEDDFFGVQIGFLERMEKKQCRDCCKHCNRCEYCEAEDEDEGRERERLSIPVVLKLHPKSHHSEGLYIINATELSSRTRNDLNYVHYDLVKEAIRDLRLNKSMWGCIEHNSWEPQGEGVIRLRRKRSTEYKPLVANLAFKADDGIQSGKAYKKHR